LFNQPGNIAAGRQVWTQPVPTWSKFSKA